MPKGIVLFTLLFLLKQSGAVIMRFNIILYRFTVTDAEQKSEFVFTKETPYLALTGELWGVYCEHFGEN